jgi:hypothetical protein
MKRSLVAFEGFDDIEGNLTKQLQLVRYPESMATAFSKTPGLLGIGPDRTLAPLKARAAERVFPQ